MDFSRQVNYQSDFDVLLNLTDESGAAIGYPEFDFTAKFSCGATYEVGQKNGVKRGVSDEDGKVKVVFNNHRLSPGALKLTFSADIPDAAYPDGKKLHVLPVETDVKLITEASEVSTGIVIDVKLPFTKPVDESDGETSDTTADDGGETTEEP